MVKLVEYKGGNGGHDFDVDVDATNLASRREALAEVSRPLTFIGGQSGSLRS